MTYFMTSRGLNLPGLLFDFDVPIQQDPLDGVMMHFLSNQVIDCRMAAQF